MKTILYPGSFDPVTIGHLDIIERAAALFDRLLVGVLHNPGKPGGLFTVPERLELLRLATAHLGNVEVVAHAGLLVDAVKALGADAVLRGVRGFADWENEAAMAAVNRRIGEVETLLLPASPGVGAVSARWVREIGQFGGDISALVPEAVAEKVRQKLGRHRTKPDAR
ncbi:MAG: pantetheine-phosphate adenylyltransferase [Oscillospiraceae bacterium]|nr:pantetheine-phosphate adenylyltransferase [Oscillospiraceae bacterium]